MTITDPIELVDTLMEHYIPRLHHSPECGLNDEPDVVCSCAVGGMVEQLSGFRSAQQ